ncbi:MAG TPA: extracellular solute-binding protein [Aggregatilineaceae bacterium]|jgi:inositol-phosphate transport system substrate-binding protein|nr:extracellular solute-binding protein [Anaerolineae bacterium]HMM26781.1 extracellular solute-binding protein [Aggregatilineaceae bacterium]
MKARRILPLLLITALVLSLAPLTTALAQETVNIRIRCKSTPPTEDWRCNNFAEVVEEVEAELGIDIELELIQDNAAWGDYKQEFQLSAEAGEAVDIVLSGHEDIGAWAAAGFIIPLDEMIPNYPEFADIVPSLWESMKGPGGAIYGIPQDAEARPLYFSKPLLSDLGWSDEEIEALPEQIYSGEFTFADMLDVAEQAVEEGVVEEGYGFWHRPVNGGDFLYFYAGMGGEVLDEEGNLVFDQDAALKVFQMLEDARNRGIMNGSHLGIEWPDWHTTVAPGEKVLFATGGTWFWGDWAVNYVADRGGEDYLWENIGFAPIPAMETGAPITLTHPLAYMVSASSDHPDVALALIAAITTPEANNRHAIGSAHLGILNTQLESAEYQESEFLAAAHPMLDFAIFLPNHPNWGAWSEAYWSGIQAVESGELDAQAALDVVVGRLQNEVEGIVIR